MNQNNQFKDLVEICDGNGKVLGSFSPKAYGDEFEPSQPQMSDDELTQRSKLKAKGISTEEFIKRLEQL